MANETAIEKSRHYFRNCKAAFRLLQGALLSKQYEVSDEQLSRLEKKFIELENEFEKTSPRTYNAGDPTLNDVQQFFLTVNKANLIPQAQLNAIPKLLPFGKKVLVIDDQYKKSGWKEVFELIFGNGNVEGVTDYQQALSFVKTNHSNLLMIFNDLNLPYERITSAKKVGKEGFSLMREISHFIQRIPLVAFTAYDSAVIAKKAFEDGAWDYFAKEPAGEETKQYKDSIDYYTEFIEIANDFIKYDTEYNGYWSSIQSLEQQLQTNVPDDFRKIVIGNLRMAYKYLIMDYAIRFNPRFLEIDKYEEVIFQSAKALETFLSYLFNFYKQLPPQVIKKGVVHYPSPTLGGKLGVIENNLSVFKLTQNWLDRAEKVADARNKNSHQDYFLYGKWDTTTRKFIPEVKPRFITKHLQTTEQDAFEVFKESIALISEAHQLATNTP